MFCIHCGKKIEDNSRFCIYCGKKIAPESNDENNIVPSQAVATAKNKVETQIEKKVTTENETNEKVVNTQQMTKEGKKTGKIWAIFGGIAIVVAFGLALFWIVSNRISLFSSNQKNINLNDYVTYEMMGENGEGRIQGSFDRVKFGQEYKEIINVDFKFFDLIGREEGMSGKAVLLFMYGDTNVAGWEAFADFLVPRGTWSVSNNLKNGDVTTYEWNVSDEDILEIKKYAEDFFDVNVIIEPFTVTVEGLAEAIDQPETTEKSMDDSEELKVEAIEEIESEIEIEEETVSDYILADSATCKITKADLQGLTVDECRIARNEIYARHGRKFQDEELQAYFNSKSWYEGTIEPDRFTNAMLTDLEIDNAQFIKEYEDNPSNFVGIEKERNNTESSMGATVSGGFDKVPSDFDEDSLKTFLIAVGEAYQEYRDYGAMQGSSREQEIYYYAYMLNGQNASDKRYGVWEKNAETLANCLRIPGATVELYKKVMPDLSGLTISKVVSDAYDKEADEYCLDYYEMLPYGMFPYDVNIESVKVDKAGKQLSIVYKLYCLDEENQWFERGSGTVVLEKTTDRELIEYGLKYKLISIKADKSKFSL